MNKALSLTIRRHGSTAFHGQQSIVLDDLRVDSFRPDAIVLTSAYVADFQGKAHHDYEINVPMETARVIVEAYCKKLTASPEIAAGDAKLKSLAPALVHLLSTIICDEPPTPKG